MRGWLEAAIIRCVHCGIKGMDIDSQNTLAVAFKQSSIGTKRPKVCQENILTPLHHQKPEPLMQGRMDSFFHVVQAKFSLNVCLLSKSRLRPGNVFPVFYCPILVSHCEL